VPKMRPRVYVVNRSSDVILRFRGRHFLYFDLSVADRCPEFITRRLVCGAEIRNYIDG
jgi:hypothetical protein